MLHGLGWAHFSHKGGHRGQRSREASPDGVTDYAAPVALIAHLGIHSLHSTLPRGYFFSILFQTFVTSSIIMRPCLLSAILNFLG